jgi:hypothetical protein
MKNENILGVHFHTQKSSAKVQSVQYIRESAILLERAVLLEGLTFAINFNSSKFKSSFFS